MTVERCIRVIAGLFIVVSVALGAPHSPVFVNEWFLAFTAFVGLNLFQFGFTNFCPMGLILKKLGVPEGTACCAPGTGPSAKDAGCCNNKSSCC